MLCRVQSFESVDEILKYDPFERKISSAAFLWSFHPAGPVVRKPINANHRLKVNQGSHFACYKFFRKLILS